MVSEARLTTDSFHLGLTAGKPNTLDR